METRRVLFVCHGNICRSPLGEGVLRHRALELGLGHLVETASAGTHGWHKGAHPDPRSIAVAKARGIDIARQKARQVRAEDFNRYDLIFAMDRVNLRDLVRLAPHDSFADIHLFMDYVGGGPRDVPDPYYGDMADFEAVYAMIETGCDAILKTLFRKQISGDAG